MEKNTNKLLWVLIGVVILLLLFRGFGMGGYGMMGFGFPFMLLFWGVVMWLIVSLINSAQSGKKEDSDPITILKKRYARGEITNKESESIKKELM